jgi:hypothetical protein
LAEWLYRQACELGSKVDQKEARPEIGISRKVFCSLFLVDLIFLIFI